MHHRRIEVLSNLKRISVFQWSLAFILLVIIAVGTYFVYSLVFMRDETNVDLSVYGIAKDAELQLIRVRRGELANNVTVNGSLKYSGRTDLKFGANGKVDSVAVKVGDMVPKGHRLAALSSDASDSVKKVIVDAEKALREAEKALDELLNPDQYEIEAAELKIPESDKELRDAKKELEELLADKEPIELENARLDIVKRHKALEDAQKALEELEKFDRTVLINAEVAILNAERNLENHRDALERERSTRHSDLALVQAKADIAAATYAVAIADEALQDATSGADSKKVMGLRARIAEADDDIELAIQNKKQISDRIKLDQRDSDKKLAESEKNYQDVFLKWLGMNITEWGSLAPDDIFQASGTDLHAIFDAAQLDANKVGGSETTLNLLDADDPATAWDESLIHTWVMFGFIELLVDCGDKAPNAGRACIRKEFDDAWDSLELLKRERQTADINAIAELDAADDRITEISSASDNLRDNLDDLLKPATEEKKADLRAKLELAKAILTDAEAELEEVRAKRAAQSDRLADIERDIALAIDAKDDAHDELRELKVAPTALDRELAEAKVAQARIAHGASQKFLRELKEPPNQADVELLQQKIVTAQAKLDKDRADLALLIDPDDGKIEDLRYDVASAIADLESARADLEELNILAPFNGIIAGVAVSAGDEIVAGKTAIVIAQADVFELEGSVDEVDVLMLQVGDEVNVRLESMPGQVLSGRLSEISPFGSSSEVFETSMFGASSSNIVTYPVKIETRPPNGAELVDGLTAVADVVIRVEEDVLMVPIQALLGSVSAPAVLVVDDTGQYRLAPVSLGISDDFWTELKSGVEEGETIVMPVISTDTSRFLSPF